MFEFVHFFDPTDDLTVACLPFNEGENVNKVTTDQYMVLVEPDGDLLFHEEVESSHVASYTYVDGQEVACSAVINRLE